MAAGSRRSARGDARSSHPRPAGREACGEPSDPQEPWGWSVGPFGHGATDRRRTHRTARVALILDTGPLYASLDRDDQDHAACRGLIASSSELLVIPSPVLVEVDYWIRKRLRPAVFDLLVQDILTGAYRVEDLNAGDYERIHEICLRFHDADIGFVDAAVLAVTERLGEHKLATLDRRHFHTLRPRHTQSLQLLP